MAMDRRGFFRLAGLGTLGLAGGAVLHSGAQRVIRRVGLPPAEGLEAGRWAMVVDLQACLREKGCRKCIEACDQAHNIPHWGNHDEEVKWIWKERYGEAFPNQKHDYMAQELAEREILVFCNHCDNPPCTRVCPTGATWKREDGIVMMDWHRCIGCRYCIAGCPYGSRSFNWRDPRKALETQNPDFPTRTRGVVEKCNFCEERLAKGQLPACVEACQERCLIFGDLADDGSEVRRILHERHAIRRKPGLGTQPEVFYLV
jgi:molybdopterin-containing oxidoreductase family iron-sulfur binding subunit